MKIILFGIAVVLLGIALILSNTINMSICILVAIAGLIISGIGAFGGDSKNPDDKDKQ